VGKMKKCNLSNCDAEHEGYCILNLKECNAKSDDDLITEDEFENQREYEDAVRHGY
jgi:hypothetical protein